MISATPLFQFILVAVGVGSLALLLTAVLLAARRWWQGLPLTAAWTIEDGAATETRTRAAFSQGEFDFTSLLTIAKRETIFCDEVAKERRFRSVPWWKWSCEAIA
jgi:hypothetical protein